MRRLFSVWNRGYKVALFVASDAHEALHLAAEHKHLRRAQNYRMFRDVTDTYMEDPALAGPAGSLQKLLDADKPGIAELANDVWHLNGKPVE